MKNVNFKRNALISSLFSRARITFSFPLEASRNVFISVFRDRRFKVREENIVHTNPAFEEWDEDGNRDHEFIIMEELGQDDVGFHDPYFHPVIHYESRYDGHGRSGNVIDSWQSNQSMV